MSKQRLKPNLLVVGVAKSGTSSLHQYLEQHPKIFMSPAKEPRFISSQVCDLPLGGPKDDKVEAWYIKNEEEYLNLFEGVSDEKVIGESSADTFYFHQKTIPFIQQYFGDPKIIVVLRDPVKRAFSAYQHLRRDEREHLSFDKGLEKENDRINNNFELIYHYKAVGLYAKGLTAFLNSFSNVKVILTEELSKNTKEVLADLFDFLGVENDISIDTSQKYNMSGIPRSKKIHQVLFEGSDSLRIVKPLVRRLLNKKQRDRLSRRIQQKNLKRLTIEPHTKEKLMDFYRSDIMDCEKILGRSLELWKNS
ncbi:MAG: sulfotransferase [Bacteroidota bacterium]